MTTIVPAVLPASREELEVALARLLPVEEVEAVQIDVVDGRFSSPASWPYGSGSHEFAEMIARGEMLPYFERFRYDIDLMIADPEAATASWIAAGASRITVHAESTTYLPRIITDLQNIYGHDPGLTAGVLSFGLAIGIETDLALLEQYVEHLDYVQFMGIAKIGRQGEPFDERVLLKIKTFRKRHPNIPVQVDGGVSLRSAPLLLAVGVDRLIVGSALMAATDLGAEIEKFEALTSVHGVYE